MTVSHTAWRVWCCFVSFTSSGQGCQGKVCCCKVKAGRPTAVPDPHNFWKDNDKCDCNLACCGLQSKTNTGPVVATTTTAPAAPYVAPQQAAPPTYASQPVEPYVQQQPVQQQPVQYHEPVKPSHTATGYPAVQ